MINPFLISGYKSPGYFCDREKETERIISAIKNNRHLTLFSNRRLGKTGLLHHVIYKLKKSKEYNLIYFDIFATKNINDFINEFSKGVIFSPTNDSKSFIQKIGTVFKSIKPSITYDSLTGIPSISFSFNTTKEAFNSLESVFSILEQSNKHNVVFIDEFQQVTAFPQKTMEAVLRTHIQKLNNSTFIFSGSQKHLLLSMFGEHNRPFYQSSELMLLEKIEKNKYKKFIQSKFKKNNINIDYEALNFILEWTKVHTYYVQYVCNKIFSSAENEININDVKYQCSLILNENEPLYLNYRNLLSNFQWELLKAIALEDGIKKITSKEFIHKYKLGSASSIQRGIKSLLLKELISYEENKYYLQDVFFSKWFSFKYNSFR